MPKPGIVAMVAIQCQGMRPVARLPHRLAAKPTIPPRRRLQPVSRRSAVRVTAETSSVKGTRHSASCIKVEQQLGEGSYGTVFQVGGALSWLLLKP